MRIVSAILAHASAGDSPKSSGRFFSVARLSAIGAVAGLACLLPASRAHAQLNAKVLIGDAVPAEEVDKHTEINDSLRRFYNGDIKNALQLLKDAKDKYPKLPPPELMLAKMFYSLTQQQQQMAQLGHEALEATAKQYPDDPETFIIFGEMALRERRIAEAQLVFEHAKKLAADFKENAKRARNFQIASENGLAQVAEAREKYADAQTHLEAILAIVDPATAPKSPNGTVSRDPQSANPHQRLGAVLFRADKDHKNAAGAYDQFRMAADADKKAVPAPDVSMAELYEEAARQAGARADGADDEAKMHEMARKFVQRAVDSLAKETGTDADAKQYKVNTLLLAFRWALSTAQPEKARDYADMALKADPNSLDAKFARGVVARYIKNDKNEVAKSEALLGEVAEARPSNFDATNQYAQVLAEQLDKTKRDKAQQLAQINEKLYGQSGGQSAEAAATLAWVLYQQEDKGDAAKILDQVFKSGGASPDAMYYGARILQDIGKTEDAVKAANQALKMSKSFVHYAECKDLVKKYEGVAGSGDSKPDDSKTPPKNPDKS